MMKTPITYSKLPLLFITAFITSTGVLLLISLHHLINLPYLV